MEHSKGQTCGDEINTIGPNSVENFEQLYNLCVWRKLLESLCTVNSLISCLPPPPLHLLKQSFCFLLYSIYTHEEESLLYPYSITLCTTILSYFSLKSAL